MVFVKQSVKVVPLLACGLLALGLSSAPVCLSPSAARETIRISSRATKTRYKVVEIVSPDGEPIFANNISPHGQFVTGMQEDEVLLWHKGNVQRIDKGEGNVPWVVSSQGIAAGSTWSRMDSYHAARWINRTVKLLFGGYEASHSAAIDDAGTIYGGRYHRTSKATWEGFIHHQDGSTQWIDGPDGRQCVVSKVSAAGRICVVLFKQGNLPRTYTIFSEGKFTLLPPTAGGEKAVVRSLNDHDLAVGNEIVDTRPVPVRWRAGNPEILPNFPQDRHGTAMGVNNAGDIVGIFTIASDPKATTAFLYRRGTFTNLDTCVDRSDIKLTIPLAITNEGLILSQAVIGDRATSVLLIPKK